MTVIAYTAGILASDSRASDGFQILSSNEKKLFRLANGAMVGTAGDCDWRAVEELLAKASPKRMPTKDELRATRTEFRGLMVFPKGEVFEIGVTQVDNAHDTQWEAYVYSVNEPFAAVGCGEGPARTAMRLGKTAVEAVRIAIAENAGCGGPVQSLRLADCRVPSRTKRGAGTKAGRRT